MLHAKSHDREDVLRDGVTSTAKTGLVDVARHESSTASISRSQTFPRASFFHTTLRHERRKKERKRTQERRPRRQCRATLFHENGKILQPYVRGETSWNRLACGHLALPIFTHATYVSDFVRRWLLIARNPARNRVNPKHAPWMAAAPGQRPRSGICGWL